MKGVKAVVTRADFSKNVPFESGLAGDLRNILKNVMKGKKALYDRNTVEADAAPSALNAHETNK